MRKFAAEIEEVLVKVEDAINKDLKKGGDAFPTNTLRDDCAREVGANDYRQLRAILANAIKDNFKVKTHKYRDLFQFVNDVCKKYGHKDVVFQIEKIVRKRSEPVLNAEAIKKLLTGEDVTLADGRTMKLVDITIDHKASKKP